MPPKRPKPPIPTGAQASTPQTRAAGPTTLQLLRQLGTAGALIALAALTSPVSQLSQAPVFGSLPSSIPHRQALAGSYLLGLLVRGLWKPKGPSPTRYIPLYAACVPLLQYVLFQYSESLGLAIGPVTTGFLSCNFVVAMAAYAVAAYLEGVSMGTKLGADAAFVINGVMSFALCYFLERQFARRLPDSMMTWPHFNPLNLQVAIALGLVLTLPQTSTLFLSTILLTNLQALVSPYGSGPYSSPFLEASLRSQNYTLLSRHWSNTGYLSVLENTAAGYRVLRCDHSLLGGEWQLTPQRRQEGWQVPESIYAVFTMLEAVRLLDVTPQKPDAEASALVIGLGIGTAPKAFISHNIDTTIVELDPLVHDMATRYFDLQSNHTAVLSDAIGWVPTQSRRPSKKQYDYIIHDVFTGGAEPLPLFTQTFLSQLRSLLTPNGVAAINYAGDLALPLTGRVLNTIDHAFDGQCALYRDNPPSAQTSKGDEGDFSNLIVFCRNSPGAIDFREPTERDFLGSFSRRRYLYPRPELAVEFPLRGTDVVLEGKDVGSWRREQEESASRHWGIMRSVLPSRVWELY